MKTKEQYLDDLKKGAIRSLENETAEENKALLNGVRAFLDTLDGRLLFLLGPETSFVYAFVAGTMAQKKESQNVIDHLHDSTQQVIDLCGEMAEKLSEADVEKFLPRVREITKNCKLDYVPFKGD